MHSALQSAHLPLALGSTPNPPPHRGEAIMELGNTFLIILFLVNISRGIVIVKDKGSCQKKTSFFWDIFPKSVYAEVNFHKVINSFLQPPPHVYYFGSRNDPAHQYRWFDAPADDPFNTHGLSPPPISSLLGGCENFRRFFSYIPIKVDKNQQKVGK